MSYSEVFRKHYVQLIQCLPMDDDIFTAKLFQKGLLPYNWKAKLKSLSTSAAKATEFLDNIIKPNILAGNSGNFTLLLSVMKDGGDNNIVKLADTIMSEISLSSCCATGELNNDCCTVCTVKPLLCIRPKYT